MPETFDMCVKVGASGDTSQSVTTVQFGDGYKQKSSIGINNESSTWSISMTGTKKELQPFVDFLKRHKGAISFYWTPPFEDKSLFTAEGWKSTTHGAGLFTITTEFEQVFFAGVDDDGN